MGAGRTGVRELHRGGREELRSCGHADVGLGGHATGIPEVLTGMRGGAEEVRRRRGGLRRVNEFETLKKRHDLARRLEGRFSIIGYHRVIAVSIVNLSSTLERRAVLGQF